MNQFKLEPGESITLLAHNCIRLLNAMTDTELEDAIKRLNLVEEYCENFAQQENKDANTVYEAIQRRPENARALARLILATNFIIYPGAKKYLRMRRAALHNFALDFPTRKTAAAQLVWDLRLAHNI